MSGLTTDYSGIKLSVNLDESVDIIKNIFNKDCVLRIRRIKLPDGITECAVIYLDGMVNNEILNDSVIRPLLTRHEDILTGDIADNISEKILFVNDSKKTDNVADILRAVLYGDTLLLISGTTFALTLNTKGWRTRGISEPEDERILQGPREGFDEAALFNVAMIRRKL